MLQIFSATYLFMVLTLAFLASVYITGAIILVSEMLQDTVWFEDADGFLHLVSTRRS
jgi:hypothetical protein